MLPTLRPDRSAPMEISKIESLTRTYVMKTCWCALITEVYIAALLAWVLKSNYVPTQYTRYSLRSCDPLDLYSRLVGIETLITIVNGYLVSVHIHWLRQYNIYFLLLFLFYIYFMVYVFIYTRATKVPS